MDLDKIAESFNLINSSILAFGNEKTQAEALKSAALNGSERAELLLRKLALEIVARECGQPPIVAVPRDEQTFQPVVAGLEIFAKELSTSLEDKTRIIDKRRRTWLMCSVLSLIAGIVIPLISLTLGQLIASYSRFDSLILALSASTLSVALSIVCFRVQSQADETLRRLSEKQIALAFLSSSINLVGQAKSGAPYVEEILRQGFSVFVAHYEGQAPPVTASDILSTALVK